MVATMLAHEGLLRMAAAVGIFAAVAAWEALAPRRRRELPREARWTGNLAVAALDAAVLRLIFPVLAVGLAVLAEQRGWGLMNVLGLPVWLAFGLALPALDLAVYVQHRAFHAVPPLWRLHRMHHADPEFDATTGLRFHPLEIALSMGIKLAVVALLGPPAIAVLLFEVLLNGTAMFNHANARVPAGLDRVLRRFVVTPDMHRVHHSVRAAERDSNFGFCLPWWDRLLGTYREHPADGHERMALGVAGFRDRRELRLDRMLLQPFRAAAREPAPTNSA